ncbi:MAG: glycosyltransferase N-terminal domain-containing protein [Candidatus Binatus sp.]|uniref:3-deoxy-D-manno-octulosonic acid transferase n=1 Tax=Candidatus Binatus sp. TaxID=2811406 RepID=UPI00271C5165|nr:glycosyltransferase N-terminal domain-containing protein [Candidatus Binatus sp.]MDO8432003.1 glycosyltransferase N-terminal domain-containing protein [Candidatus Binatus sp.]
MLREIYNMLWYAALPVALVAAHPSRLGDLRERLGHGDFPESAGAPRIWIHAASVGEVEAIRGIANSLLELYPGAVIVVTTMTTAGRDAARQRIPDAAAWMMAPLDARRAVRSFLLGVHPTLVLIAEGELWPNYFFESVRFGAKIAIVNGRMSERSLRRYRPVRKLFKTALDCCSTILAQSREDARRYMSFDTHTRVVVIGNTKIDDAAEAANAPLRAELEAFAKEREILVAGSTAPGEEAVVVGAYRELRKRFPGLALAIAPRHLDRIGDAEKVLRASSLDYVRATELSPERAAGAADILLIDTMGELRGFYRRAAIAFVGGSLAPGRGGQSPIEPASAGVPVLVGPYHDNQKELLTSMVRGGGARIVANARDLAAACAKWLEDEDARHRAGRNAAEATRHRSGGARLALRQIRSLIDAD